VHAAPVCFIGTRNSIATLNKPSDFGNGSRMSYIAACGLQFTLFAVCLGATNRLRERPAVSAGWLARSLFVIRSRSSRAH